MNQRPTQRPMFDKSTDKTAVEIITGALALIREHGYSPSTDDRNGYTVPEAFDEVAFNDRDYSMVPLMMENILGLTPGELIRYPDEYMHAKDAYVLNLVKNEETGGMMPTRQSVVEAQLEAALDSLTGGVPEKEEAA